MKKLFKKILCFSLSLIIALSSCVISAYAESTLDGAVPGSINLYISDKGTINELRAMQLNDIIYVDATELANLLECRFIKTDNYIFFAFGRTYYNFYYSSKKVGVVYASWINNVGETSFESIAETIKDDEHNAVWVPLRFTLAVLNCDFIIGNECIITSIPKSTVFDLQYDWIKNKKRYSFDWNDDYYIDDVNADTMRKSAYVVQLINGMISMEASSIVEAVSCLNRDISGYDIKYGQDFSRLYIVPSANELDSINSTISKAVKPYNNTAKVVKNINGTINELSQNTANSAKLCQEYINGINNANGNIAEFNKSFSQMKKNADKEAKWLKNTELLREIDKELNFERISDAVSAAADIISIMTYVSEYAQQDKFSVASMEWVLNNNYSKEYLSKATLNSCNTYVKSLDTNVAAYSAYRYFCDNIGSILGDSVKALGGKGISSAIGANANWMLFAWSIAKNTIPFFKDGLSNTDKMLLTTYAQCFQYETYRYVKEISDKVFVNNSVNEDYLNDYVMSWYSFFKSAYICRDAALGVSDDIPQFRIDDQNQKNKEIASNLSFLRQASFENDKPEKYVGTIFGFFPSVRKAFIKDYNEQPVIQVFKLLKKTYEIVDFLKLVYQNREGVMWAKIVKDNEKLSVLKKELIEDFLLSESDYKLLIDSFVYEISPFTNLNQGEKLTLSFSYDKNINKRGITFENNKELFADFESDETVYYRYLKENDDGVKLSNTIVDGGPLKSFPITQEESGVICENLYDYDNDDFMEMMTISLQTAVDDSSAINMKLDLYDYVNGKVTKIDSISSDLYCCQLWSGVWNDINVYIYENQIGIIKESAIYSRSVEWQEIYMYKIERSKIITEKIYMKERAHSTWSLYEVLSDTYYYNDDMSELHGKINEGQVKFRNELKDSFIYPYISIDTVEQIANTICTISDKEIYPNTDKRIIHYNVKCKTDLYGKIYSLE